MASVWGPARNDPPATTVPARTAPARTAPACAVLTARMPLIRPHVPNIYRRFGAHEVQLQDLIKTVPLGCGSHTFVP
jgi:hypothetical protein